MNDEMMTRERLGALLDAYGGDLSRWPAPSRVAAEALIARDPTVHRLLDQARALDTLLDQAPAPLPSGILRARVLARRSPTLWRQSLGALWPFGPVWQPAMAFALIAALGIALGAYVGGPDRLVANKDVNESGIAGLDGDFDEDDLL